MPTVSYENMSDTELEQKRNEFQAEIARLRAASMEMGKILDKRRMEGTGVLSKAELKAEIERLQALHDAQLADQTVSLKTIIAGLKAKLGS